MPCIVCHERFLEKRVLLVDRVLSAAPKEDDALQNEGLRLRVMVKEISPVSVFFRDFNQVYVLKTHLLLFKVCYPNLFHVGVFHP
jgi:hypothetical protein